MYLNLTVTADIMLLQSHLTYKNFIKGTLKKTHKFKVFFISVKNKFPVSIQAKQKPQYYRSYQMANFICDTC